jgi:hypothetical protein
VSSQDFSEFEQELPRHLEAIPTLRIAGPAADAPYSTNALDRDHPLSPR